MLKPLRFDDLLIKQSVDVLLGYACVGAQVAQLHEHRLERPLLVLDGLARRSAHRLVNKALCELMHAAAQQPLVRAAYVPKTALEIFEGCHELDESRLFCTIEVIAQRTLVVAPFGAARALVHLRIRRDVRALVC